MLQLLACFGHRMICSDMGGQYLAAERAATSHLVELGRLARIEDGERDGGECRADVDRNDQLLHITAVRGFLRLCHRDARAGRNGRGRM
jgi:hypothetical protein